MDYQVMECRYNYSPDETDILFANNDRREAIEAANEFGPGTVVLHVDETGKKREFLPLLTDRIWGLKNSRFSAKESELVRQDIAEFITRRIFIDGFECFKWLDKKFKEY